MKRTVAESVSEMHYRRKKRDVPERGSQRDSKQEKDLTMFLTQN